MELTSSNIQVLLQAADYLERRERGIPYSLRAVKGGDASMAFNRRAAELGLLGRKGASGKAGADWNL